VEVLVPVPRPVLPGGTLKFPVALTPEIGASGDRRVLPRGDYTVELSLVADPGATSEASGPTVTVPVRVMSRRPGRPWAPLRLFARHDPLPAPHFVFMPEWGDR
jgi:hypothetical protein